jgi:tetratricopeptide (TPR) repeat protein
VSGNLSMGKLSGILIASLLCIFAFDTRTTGQWYPAAPTPLSQAQAALAERNPQKAIDILSSYLDRRPQNVSARLLLGQAYTLTGQAELAKAEFEKVLQNSPSSVSALVALAQIYQHEGRLEDSEAMLARAVKASSGNPKLRMQWAVVLARLHRFKDAGTAIRGLAPPDSADRIAFYRLKASIAAGLGDFNTAASEMERALALHPGDDSLLLATAAAHLQAAEWRRASDLAEPLYARSHNPQAGLVVLQAQLEQHRDFHEILQSLRNERLQPADELSLHQRLAELLIAHGEFSTSVEDLQRALDLEPQRGEVAYNLALAQFKAGRLDDATQTAEQCRALQDSAELEDLLGDIQEARGDNLAAARAYQAAIKLAPGQEKYRLSLAVEFMRHSNFDGARVVLNQAAMLWPNSWRIQLALGMVEHFAGSDENAGRILLHAAQLAPQPETALRYLGEIQTDQASAPDLAAIEQLCAYSDRHAQDGKMQYYCGALLFRRDYGSGEKKRADEILHRLQTAASLEPDDASPHCQMGRVYRWLDRWGEAKKALQACVRLDPNSADGHYRLAQIYQRLGDADRSKQEMTAYQAASQRVANENAHRDESMKMFILTIQKAADQNAEDGK